MIKNKKQSFLEMMTGIYFVKLRKLQKKQYKNSNTALKMMFFTHKNGQ